MKTDRLATDWYLYQINTDLGFVVPCELMKVNISLKIIYNKIEFLVPKFQLYGNDEIITIKIVCLKSIQYRNQLKDFCQYLFEYVFDDMNTNSILQFDIDNSTFKLLPCLLTSMLNE